MIKRNEILQMTGGPLQPSPLSRKLASAGLSTDEIIRVQQKPRAAFRNGTVVSVRTQAHTVLTSGWVIGQRHLSSGMRQILRVYLPGDVIDDVDLQPANLIALTSASTIEIPQEISATVAFQKLLQADRDAKNRQMINHIIRLGRLDAAQRTANFLLEIDARWRRAFPDTAHAINFPMKQTHLGEYLTLSAVHVNRTLMALRRDGLIKLKNDLEILNRTELKVIAFYNEAIDFG